jgi:predicted enzyme related to lactoylglutathione lyase
MGYVAVDDVDAAVKKSTALGGKVYVPGTDIPNTGRFAVLADPAGAEIAVFKSANPAEGPRLPIAWTELSSTDPDASFRYLEAMFGWTKADSMEMPGGGVYQMLKGDGDAFAGMSKSSMGMSAWAYYFGCMDCRGTFAKAKEMGSREMYAPMQVPGGGWAALLTDPQGAAFGLFSME